MKINTIQIRNPYLEKSMQVQKPKPIAQATQPKKVVNIDLNKGSILDVII